MDGSPDGRRGGNADRRAAGGRSGGTAGSGRAGKPDAHPHRGADGSSERARTSYPPRRNSSSGGRASSRETAYGQHKSGGNAAGRASGASRGGPRWMPRPGYRAGENGLSDGSEAEPRRAAPARRADERTPGTRTRQGGAPFRAGTTDRRADRPGYRASDDASAGTGHRGDRPAGDQRTGRTDGPATSRGGYRGDERGGSAGGRRTAPSGHRGDRPAGDQRTGRTDGPATSRGGYRQGARQGQSSGRAGDWRGAQDGPSAQGGPVDRWRSGRSDERGWRGKDSAAAPPRLGAADKEDSGSGGYGRDPASTGGGGREGRPGDPGRDRTRPEQSQRGTAGPGGRPGGRPGGSEGEQGPFRDRGQPSEAAEHREAPASGGESDLQRPAGDAQPSGDRDHRDGPGTDRPRRRTTDSQPRGGGRERAPARADRGAARGANRLRDDAPASESRSTPPLSDDIEPGMLAPEVRAELRSLSRHQADSVARHLVAAGQLVDTEPELALQHAREARRMAARTGAVREAGGITAYHAGEWAEALTELRAARRLTGDPSHLALMAACDRAMGRPERALRVAQSP